MGKAIKILIISLVCVPFVAIGSVLAQSASSTDYRLDEQFIGSGGDSDSSSSDYNQRDAVSEVGEGKSSSDDYQLDSGYITDADPRLAFIVDDTSIAFGDLSTTETATANSTFRVLNYTSYGYVVQAFGSPPASGASVIDEMTSTAASQVGQEQYGINLRANTLPETFGADPVQVPDSSFSSGGAAGGYSTANQYRYNDGETIASAAQSSGETDYTVSYVVNVSSTTGGGRYTGHQGFICTGTY